MKTLLLLAVSVLFSVSAMAQEDSFYMTKNGRKYYCEAIGAGSGGNPIECVNKAYAGPFSSEQARELCAGAKTTAPADCALAAYNGPFSTVQAIALCKGARRVEPADCAMIAYNGPFSTDQAIRLCSRNGTIRRANCALKAYQGPYSTDEAVEICKSTNLNLLMRSLDIIGQSQTVKAKANQYKL